ncbi:MAG TPA: hypothetical protein VGP72_15910 [Planctomycetota bacterium]|jgi:hypothetical protein
MRLFSALAVLVICGSGCVAAENAWELDDFTVISGPASPRVGLGIRREGQSLQVALEVAPLGDSQIKIELGVAATKKVVLSEKDAKAAGANPTRFVFVIPSADLAANDADWENLRVGVAVAWGPGYPLPREGEGLGVRGLSQDRQRERFRHIGGSPHEGLSQNPNDWLPLSLSEHAIAVASRKNRIWIPFEQPCDGKATIVIENEKGERLRNLIAGQPVAKGAQRAEWDGLDDHSRVVAPGNYHWRSIHHPGVWPEYLFSFCNDGQPPWRTGSGTDMWGPDHSVLVAATANKEFTFLGGCCAESGYAIVAVDHTGTKRMHYNPAMGTGIETVALAADDTYLYVANDGFAWGQHIDKSKPDWKGTQKITLSRFEIKTGKPADFGKSKFAVLSEVEVGPGSANKELKKHSLQGMALAGGKLCVSDLAHNRVLLVNPATGEKTGELKLEQPGPLAAAGESIIAVSAGNIVKLSLASATETVVKAGEADVRGVAVDASGRIFVSDGKTHTVKVFSAAGKLEKEIGTPGGPYAGPYVPERMIHPRGLAVAGNGWLWVGEERWAPKRVAAWDVSTGRVQVEKYGPTAYGASGAGFDAQDPTRWIGQGALWKVDLATKIAKCQALLEPEGNSLQGISTHYSFVHQDGRTFLIGYSGVTFVSELKADGSMKALAMIGSAHRYCFGRGWNPATAVVEAFEKAYPQKKGKTGDKGPGLLWVDKNGDGQMQADEIEFSTEAENFAGAYWGHDFHDLTLRVPATVKGKRVLIALKPEGFYAGGAPKYPALNAACASGVPIDLSGNELESSVDRFGNIVFNSDPEMKAFAPDGRQLWSFPNRWTNVHGSHNAPLPETGVMQGALFFLGMTPLDDKSDVFVINGNHGRFFVLTSDGLYLDEMFKDVRMGGTLDAYLIGGECFGGFFAKSATDGAYYLQSGHTDYRIFKLHGLDQAKRLEGTVAVTPEQVVAAERNLARKVAQTSAKKDGVVVRLKMPPAIDGKSAEWAGVPPIKWDKSGRFPVTVKAGYDAQNLYLSYEVEDSSPWVNNGKDWTLLFKTGDSVDLQLATNPAANPARTQPVPGDLRLLIAPFQGKNIAVLYRHRGAKDNPVTFNCPWRSETVDSVKQLEKAQIAVGKEGGRYRVEAAIALSDLGLNQLDGKTLKADFGVIYGDDAGTINMLRSYWSNQATMLVNDVPGEIMLSPNLWGTIKFDSSAELKVANAEPQTPPVTQHPAPSTQHFEVLGNSGEQGAALVRFGNVAASAKGPIAGGTAAGMGVVCDSKGTLWDRGGAGTLNRYAADGRLLAQYKIPAGVSGSDQIALVAPASVPAGTAPEKLVLQLQNKLYTLSTSAAPGTEPKALNRDSNCISPSSFKGLLATAQKGSVFLLNPETGDAKEIAATKDPHFIELGPDGALYAVVDGKARKFVDGKEVTAGTEAGATGWPKGSPGERPQYLDGAFYGHAWHGTIRRFSATLEPDPGVVLGGASGSFIGHLDQNSELSNGRGMAKVRENLYAVSGFGGTMHLLQWDGAKRQMEIIRRIGCVPFCNGLALDRGGQVWWHFGAWKWEDAPDTPISQGINAPEEIGQPVMLDSDVMVAPAWMWGKPSFYFGPLKEEVHVDRIEKNCAMLRGQVASAVYKEKDKLVLLAIDKSGKGASFNIGPDGRYHSDIGPVTLQTASPVKEWTALSTKDATTLLGSADGAVIELKLDGKDWKETRRWSNWGDDKFGSRIFLSADSGRLWVSDCDRHRVLVFDPSTGKLLCSFGKLDAAGNDLSTFDKPGRIAARGERAVVHDAGNQRLVKLRMK